MPAPARLPPYVHRFLPGSDVRLHLAELPGDGPSLVLLHGIGMDWRVWQAISRRLHPHFHLYALDLRGHGDSGKPRHGYSLAHYAADVEDAIDSLQLHDVTLVGSSLGGMVSVAVEAPADIVGHRVLVDPPLTGGPLRDRDMLESILAWKHGSREDLIDYLRRYNPSAGHHLLRMMAEMWQRTADGVLTEPLAEPQTYFAVDSSLRAIDAPVLILRGDPARGAVLSAAQAEHALALLPHGAARLVEGAGHAIHADRPQEFCRLLLWFLGMEDSPASAGEATSRQRQEHVG